jgi:lipopolysaccharide transport system permease protein
MQKLGFNELKEGLESWRIWHLIGICELRHRYSRSKLGQFWLTLSTGLTILIMSFIWSALFKSRLSDMLPYMAVSIILWQFFAGIISDAVNIFNTNSSYLLSQRILCSTIVIASVYRNFLMLMHNLIIIPIIFLIFWIPINWHVFLLFPALILILITAVWISYLIASLCSRFRDLSNIFNAIMQLAFYITPVIWKPGFLGENLSWIIWLNPFTYFLEIIRTPILGGELSFLVWVVAFLITFIGLLFSLIFIGKYRRQILYWI